MSATPEQVADRLEALFGGVMSPLHPRDTATCRAAASLIRAQSERERVLVAKIAEMSKPEWFYDMLDGETGAADVESIINDMDMNGVMRVCGARQVWRKWVAHKCLTVDSDGEPDEVSYETFETPEEAERCWPESLAACRAAAALKAAP